jgi:uncharacterized protein YjbI with pentapeptide repeats
MPTVDELFSKRPRKAKCRFKFSNDLDSFSCEHPPIHDNLCIFHLPKEGVSPQSTVGANRTNVVQEFAKKFYQLDRDSAESEEIDFRGFQFPRFVFEPQRFNKRAVFDYCVFHEPVSFSVWTPNDTPEHDYDDKRQQLFVGSVSFRYAEFKEAVSFSCEVGDSINLSGATFHKDVEFRLAGQNGTFDETVFKGKTEFSDTSFDSVTFYRAKFEGAVDFIRFSAKASADFSTAEFFAPVLFSGCHVGGGELVGCDVSLIGRQLESRVEASTDFGFATFHKSLEFYENFLEGEVRFRGTQFLGRTIIDNTRGHFGDYIDFANVILPKDETIVFEKVNLARASFHDTNLEKVVFRDVVWGRSKSFLRGGSNVLWDEIRPLDGMRDYIDDSKTADNYRQLVLNYEAKRDYATAETFHIGEMEMRRKSESERNSDYYDEADLQQLSFFRRHWYVTRQFLTGLAFPRTLFNAYTIYLISSRYGTNYRQAFLVLVLLLVGAANVFLFSGLKASKENSETPNDLIDYTILPTEGYTIPTVGRYLTDFRNSFLYTFEVATFQKERNYEPVSWHSRAVVYFALIIIGGQAAMFLFALRRQFRR